MPKLIWEKKLQEAVKRQQRFGWSVREKRGKVLVQRYYPDTNKKTTVALPIAWEPNQELSVLNALRNINDCMQNSGCNLKEAVEILYKDNAHKINLDWKKLIEDFKEYKNISKSSWEGNYSYFLNEIKTMMGSPNEPTTGKAILEKLVKNKKDGAGKKRVVSNAKTFLEFIVVKKGLDERFLPPSDLIIKELKGGKSKKSYKKERLKDDEILFLLDDLPKTEVGQSWKFAISLCFVFGLRAVELNYMKPKEDQLHISYKKVSANGFTDKRDIDGLSTAAVPDLAAKLLLELKTKSSKLPESCGKGKNDSEVGRAMVQYLKRQSKFWNKLQDQYAEDDLLIGSYSFRHSFAYRGVFLYEINQDDLAVQMGHDLQTHLRNYRRFHDEKGRKERFKKSKAKMLENSNNL